MSMVVLVRFFIYSFFEIRENIFSSMFRVDDSKEFFCGRL